MISLCGLALSSLFVINNKAVVHADVANANQNNNAISWDSDSDAAQNIQNDSEQSQQPAVQKADSTDDNQQNADSVRDSRVETSNVESSSVQRHVANQNTAVQSQKVSNVNDAEASTPVVINNPTDDKVNVHYVDRNGNPINDSTIKDTTIDTTKTGQGSYDVPNGYQLNNPAGKYNITTRPYDGPNNVKVTGGSINHVAPKSPADASDIYNMDQLNQYNKIHVKFVDQNTGKSVGGDYDIDLAKAVSGSYTLPNGYTTNNDTYSVQKHDEVMGFDHDNMYLMWLQNILPKNTYDALRTSMLNIYEQSQSLNLGRTNPDISIEYAGIFNHRSDISDPFAYSGSDQGVKLPDMNWLKSAPDNELVADVIAVNGDRTVAAGTYYQLPASIRFDSNLGNLIHKHGDTASGFSSPLDPKNNAWMEFHVETVSTFSDTKNNVSGDTVTVPVHRINSYEFADNSGNVKSVNGNTVNVVLTKPQSVNPAMDTRCQSLATRVIHINFPDGQIPDSYKDIVDSHGNLKQTVHFTRTATEDALTGNILSYGNWTSDNQDHNFIGFPERTLPRIPGYTLKISPVSA